MAVSHPSLTYQQGGASSRGFLEDQTPKNWRDVIMRQYPNGQTPLTGLTSRLKAEKTDDPQFYWWTKGLPTQGGTVTNVYTDASLSTAYTTGAAAGSVYYVKAAASVIGQIRPRHQVILRVTTDPTIFINAEVISATVNGASSFVAVRLLEAEATANDLASVNNILVIGTINAEMADTPTGVYYLPTKYYNYTQIFRTPIEITRTARKTRLRTGDAYKEMKREALELHGIEMEKNFIWSVPTESTGDNGKPVRTTGGLVYAIKTYGGLVSNYVTSTSYTALAWSNVNGGRKWLNDSCETIFKYGSSRRLAFGGAECLMAIQEIAENNAQYNISQGESKWGLNVRIWTTPVGEIEFYTHPLLSIDPVWSASMIVFNPDNMKYRHIDDTFFKKGKSDSDAGEIGKDGTTEEWLTESGLEYHFPNEMAVLHGFGKLNTDA